MCEVYVLLLFPFFDVLIVCISDKYKMGAAAREIVHALRKHPQAPKIGGKIIILGVVTENSNNGKIFLWVFYIATNETYETNFHVIQ